MDSSDEYDSYGLGDQDSSDSDYDWRVEEFGDFVHDGNDVEVFPPTIICLDRYARQCKEIIDEEQAETIPKEVGGVRSLFQHAADAIGARFQFEAVELWSRRLGKGMTDEVQLAVMKASFPVDKELIRHYAYLSRKENGYQAFSDLTQREERQSEQLTVKKSMQIGFTLTGTVLSDRQYRSEEQQEVQVVVSFDRRRITSTLCSAHLKCGWCKHVVKLIYYRMDCPHKVEYRLPVSDSVQRLSESEQKQFINILLSRRPLEMLALAQETLDDLFQEKRSQVAIGGDSTTTDVVEVLDLTAGGGLSDDGLWDVDLDEVRCIVSGYCHRNTRLGRYSEVQGFLCRNPSAASWLSAIQNVSRDNKTNTTVVIGELFRADKLTHPVAYPRRKELGEMLYLITDLLRKGEQSAVAILSAITEQWLDNVIGQLATEANDLRLCAVDECDFFIANELNMSETGVCEHVKNIDLLCTNSPWFLPDQLAVCWRTAVFASALDNDKVETIKSKLLAWGLQLDQAIAAGLEVRSKSHSAFEYVRRSRISDGGLWCSLLGWNGFEHAAALASQNVRSTVSLLLSMSVEFTASQALLRGLRANRAEILNTAAYFVLCLLDKGMEKAAKGLARACTTAILSLSLAETPKEEACDEEEPIATGPTKSSIADVFAVISQCHEDMSSSLWGDQSQKSLGMALVILYKVIETEDWAWSGKKAYNLKPWLRPLVGESLLHILLDVSGDSVTMISTQGMLLGLLCVVTGRDTTSPSLMEEVEYQVKKNTIVSKLCNMMAEQSEVLQEFIQLTPVLQQNMACLDAPATSLLLLHIAVLSQSQNQTTVDIVLSAVAASLHHQARFQIDMFTSNLSCDFYCCQTQCAASTLMALVVYGQSEATASVIIKSLTDSLLELLQRRRNVLHIISDTKAATGDENGEQHRQKVKVNRGKLDGYIEDMTNIVETICGQTYRSHPYYCSESTLADRLGLMKSPVTELISINGSNRERPQEQRGYATVVTSRLHEIKQQQQSAVEWLTVMELLLRLLIIAGQGRQCRRPIIELLKKAVDCVGAVTFLETLAEKGWDAALTGEEALTHFLTRPAFQQSFTCGKRRTMSRAAIGVLGQMFVVKICASSGCSERCSSLYKTACEYEMIDYLVGAALSDDCGLKQKASYSFLFCLAHAAGDPDMISHRFQIGVEAVKRWQQHVGNDRRKHASFTAVLDRGYSNSDEHIAVIGLLHLATLAVFIDTESVMTRRESKSIKWLKVENLLSIFAQNWIDPLFAFILLLEVCRSFHEQWRTVTLLATQDDPETWRCSTMTNILTKQQEFIQRPNAVRWFREVCGACICAHDLAHRCKTRLAAFIAHSKQMADNILVGGGENSGNDELPSREVYVRDFISLEHLCEIYPDDGFDFESLLKGPHEGSRKKMHRSRYQSVVEQFRGRRNRKSFY